MKTNQLRLLILLSFVITIGCTKDYLIDAGLSEEVIKASDELKRNEFKFAGILAEAISDSKELRDLLKEEALKKFDNDHDVLYEMIREQSVGGMKVHELLVQYAESEAECTNMVESMPLLTILVPTLPDFDPETWNTGNEIPLVAVRMPDGVGIPVFEPGGEKFTIPDHLIPGYPVLVVKQNERIRTVALSSLKSADIETESQSFEFIDEAFNGLQPKEKSVVIPKDEIPQHIIDAYNSGVDWHRDNIYYGLTKSNDKGAFNAEYSEYLTSFRFTGDKWYRRIADQNEDPMINSSDLWTDGAFEFKVIVYINANNGQSSAVERHFSATGFEIMEPSYSVTYGARPRSSDATIKHYYTIDKIEGKAFNPNLELASWNLKFYSIGWKLTLSEEDDSQEITTSGEVTAQYVSNFEVTAGVEKKVGLSLGGSSTTTFKSTYTIKTKMESDELGDALLNFSDPIIVGESSTSGSDRRSGSRGGPTELNGYKINEISVSNDLFLVVMPLKKN